MKHLLTTIMIIAVISVVFMCLAGKCSSNPSEYDPSDTIVDEVPVEETISTMDNEDVDSISEPVYTEYHETPIAESGNVKVYTGYGLTETDRKYGDDVFAKDETYLLRYVNDEPRDSMILVGPYSRLLGDGSRCRIVVGVDTVNLNIKRPFGKTLDLRFRDALPDCRFYRLSRYYALNDSARSTDFQINIAMRDSTPLTVRDFISDMIRDDVARCFEDYDGDKPVIPYVPMIKMENRSVEQMMQHYYTQFRKLYDKKFKPEPGSGDRAIGERYSYQYYAYPVWQNSDSTLTTWKFYNFTYMGGAHGGECEFFLTFDNETGRILGASDFFKKKDFKKAIDRLSHQLYVYHHKDDDSDELTIEASPGNDNGIDKILNETFEGKIYPRPAITSNGIVFSYRTYEKGGNSDGVMHFTQPFKKDFHLKNNH